MQILLLSEKGRKINFYRPSAKKKVPTGKDDNKITEYVNNSVVVQR